MKALAEIMRAVAILCLCVVTSLLIIVRTMDLDWQRTVNKELINVDKLTLDTLKDHEDRLSKLEGNK
jgi:hypothetical protein